MATGGVWHMSSANIWVEKYPPVAKLNAVHQYVAE
jgi:hypothetical protein